MVAGLVVAIPISAYSAQACGVPGLLQALGPIVGPTVAALIDFRCTATASGVVFGDYNPVAGDVVRLGDISVSCSLALLGGGVSLPASLLVCYDVTLSRGAATSNDPRVMSAGALKTLTYNLHTDATLSSIWGDGASGAKVSDSYLLALGALTKSYSVYGRLPAGQAAPKTGSYLDNIVVTVSY